MKSSIPVSTILVVLYSCTPVDESPIFLGQGIMAGEVTPSSVILQSRLTLSDTLIDGNLPGSLGLAKFEISTDTAFSAPESSETQLATPDRDYIVKSKFSHLKPNTVHYYRLRYGPTEDDLETSPTGLVKTLAGPKIRQSISFVVVTGMNYNKFHFGNYDRTTAYMGFDKNMGYPALAAIKKMSPDYFIGTGDNVYFDHPNWNNFQNAQQDGREPHPGNYGGKEVINEAGMRQKYHEQFVQPRFRELFRQVGTYWEKDDHDYRFNDSDPYQDHEISHELGVKNFREQLPVVDFDNDNPKTYRTHRMSQDLQIWLVEGRDYRSANQIPDGPEKSIWGQEQRTWLKETLLASDATFKILISPTPMVGPDDVYKSDNHTNPQGFRHEGDQFFHWLTENQFQEKNFYIICGDRHWQYHAAHHTGIEEFSCGALVDNNSRAGRLSGDPDSTDPLGEIIQFYIQGTAESASGGFLLVSVEPNDGAPQTKFSFYDEKGTMLYEVNKKVSE